MAKKQNITIHMGAPEWIVTFADLMSLLVCFFVLIISFSIQDQEKLQVVAGSMREAFGVKDEARRAGMIEFEGTPSRKYVKQVAVVEAENDTDFESKRHDKRRKQGEEAASFNINDAGVKTPREFALAAASLRQAWRELPEITELSDNIIIEETPTGLNIQLIDQEGRSMFPPGSKEPYERTRRLLAKMAPVLSRLPNRIKITGHTDSTRLFTRDGYTQWELSSDRANAARRILAGNGVPHDQFYSVEGKADSEPMFPDDTFLAANRRIEIEIMAEAPPLPVDHRP
ncbi:Flagellar motor rotation protein MotB [hydrothermal vent metagenome]|uniref:Flagellar motor rotation protein MotB n=1 Tax=hydrothermal vent metagenome TaxID=652676 RepID=A0A3B0TTZ2_9ZZZZ